MSPADLVMQSYGRCCASPDFFDSFYRHFLASSPQVREKFTHTEMGGQKQLLRQGILNLVMHARGMPDSKLRALGESHSRAKLDIRPELYDLWLEALLLTIGEHDKQCTAEIRQAWREVLNKGIAIIKAGY
ncbi:globin [Pseudomonas sp. HMWF032]|uniref:globin domain-containing protein n=1 Tax=unclassified Pseudomonas TaxID=196821 RepID=UPI000D3989D4|nr:MULTISPECIES: globin domain-containing protein [unclassified Pseudomonas]PTS85409.1 globin [Pseudomonas sp. HMWF032]PTT80513.1 globin [Pseudomonas sp. HMWF010]WAC43065.1 globin [Pseudomonas sp. SL4(2022)]